MTPALPFRLGTPEAEKMHARLRILGSAQLKCPACGDEQIQMMSSEVPAKWRCRKCKHRFTQEPAKASGVSVSEGEG